MTVVWIAVNDSSHPIRVIEICTNDPCNRHDQDRCDGTLFLSTKPSAIMMIRIVGVAHSDPNDRKE